MTAEMIANKKNQVMDRKSALDELSGHLDEMEGGDVVMITKRPGGKWTITSVSGDGFAVTGFGETFEEAWQEEV